MPEIMIAIRPGTVIVGGRRRMVRKGRTTAHSTHPVVRDHPEMWGPLGVDFPEPADYVSRDEYREAAGRPQPEVERKAEVETQPDDTEPQPDGSEPASGGQPELDFEPEPEPEPDPAEVRKWAVENEIKVAPRGALSRAVVEQYKQAMRDGSAA